MTVVLHLYQPMPLVLCQQVSATIEPESPVYGVLDPSASTDFSCIVIRANSAEWVVDGLAADDARIRDERKITQSLLETISEERGEYRRNLTIPHMSYNSRTTVVCTAEIIASPDDVSSPPVELNLFSKNVSTTTGSGTATESTTGNSGNSEFSFLKHEFCMYYNIVPCMQDSSVNSYVYYSTINCMWAAIPVNKYAPPMEEQQQWKNNNL